MAGVTDLLRIPDEWRPAFVGDAFAAGEAGLVFAARPVSDEWESVLAELTAAFEATRAAVRSGLPVVYVVATDDLLGRRGAGRAMVATGLLSAARTAALESQKAGTPVNTLAVEEDTDPALIARWAQRLLEAGGPTGELVHLGASHVGKTLA